MKKLRYVFFLIGLVASLSVEAEYCWMIGCKSREGYIFTQVIKDGKKESIFKGERFPSEGSEATLVTFVNMLDSPPSNREEGPYVLGPGFVIKILCYIGDEKEIVRIRIISDKLDHKG